MKIVTERIEFSTARSLIEALQRLTADGVVNLDEIYLMDPEGEPLTYVEMEQECLSDGSVAFNIIIGAPGDPNS